MDTGNSATKHLLPINQARGRMFPQKLNGRQINCSTVWRWIRKGLSGINGERIRLEAVYVGRTPHVSAEMVDRFFQRLTAAKLEQAARRDAHKDVTTSELESAGLTRRRGKR